jgi:hypothetical protein
VELGPLVALRTAQVVLVLARAELAEVLGCPGYHVLKQLKGDAAEGFAWGDVMPAWSARGGLSQTDDELIPPSVMSKNTLLKICLVSID